MTLTSGPEKAYGPLVLGSLFASFLSGLTTHQALLYFRLFSQDPKSLRAIVVIVWVLDLLHTAFTWEGMWFYVVKNFGEDSKINDINYCVPGVGITTATVTFVAHCFYIRRIFHLSSKKYWLAAPILVVAFLRMCGAFIAAAVVVRFTSFQALLLHFPWILTPSLGLSCAADILITLSMFALLRMNRNKSLTLNHVIDRLVLYAFEMGTLTGSAAIVAMLCWVVVPNKLVFLGLYFSVGKLYANSLLGSLNARYHLRNLKNQSVSKADGSNVRKDTIKDSTLNQVISTGYNAQPLEISVQRNVHCDSQANSNSLSPESEV